MYRRFLKVISNPEMKAYFERNFKPISNIPTPVHEITSERKKKKKKKTTHTEISSVNQKTTFSVISEPVTPTVKKNISNYKSVCHKSVYTVKATDFSFVRTLEGPHLAFRSHKMFCSIDSSWFDPRVLESINRTFQIQLSDYVGFRFIPYSDKQVFLDLLKQTYLDVKQQIYNEQLNSCLISIEKYIDSRINSFIYNCQNFKLESNLDDYSFNEDKQVYIYQFNAKEYLGIKGNSVRLHIPLSEILEKLNDIFRNRFYSEIVSKYSDSYKTIIGLNKIFPNRASLDVKVVVPKIFVMRFGKEKPIGIRAGYYPYFGYFRGSISSYLPGYHYQTDTLGVVFSDEVKDSLIETLRDIDSPFIITFYSAFIRMFNEGDAIIQSNYEKQLALLKPQKDEYDYFSRSSWIKYDRYNSGLSALLTFDTDNTSDWMWLTSQMKNGVFLNAYAFEDKDETLSSKYGETVKNAVKVYLTVKDVGDSYINYLGQTVHVGKYIISMYALDTAKSIYRFDVKRDKLNEAIFFIWSYFSSNNYNKRQDFEAIRTLKHLFGIIKFYKDSPLDYRTGLGYCDRKWLTDV